MEKKGYKSLRIWQKAHQFAVEVYKTSRGFPREELYGLTSQLRRAAFSVPLNIVEGQASSSKKDFLHFLNIANRSMVEAEYLLEACVELQFLQKAEYQRLENLRQGAAIALHSFISSVRSRLT